MKNNTAISKAKELIKELSGAVSVTKNKLKVDLDQAISEAKQKHFSRMGLRDKLK